MTFFFRVINSKLITIRFLHKNIHVERPFFVDDKNSSRYV